MTQECHVPARHGCRRDGQGCSQTGTALGPQQALVQSRIQPQPRDSSPFEALGWEGKGTLLGASGRLNTQGTLPSAAASTCGMRWAGGWRPIHFGLNSGCTSRPRRSGFSGQGLSWSVRNCRENPFPEVPELTLVHVLALEGASPSTNFLMPGPAASPPSSTWKPHAAAPCTCLGR